MCVCARKCVHMCVGQMNDGQTHTHTHMHPHARVCVCVCWPSKMNASHGHLITSVCSNVSNVNLYFHYIRQPHAQTHHTQTTPLSLHAHTHVLLCINVSYKSINFTNEFFNLFLCQRTNKEREILGPFYHLVSVGSFGGEKNKLREEKGSL